MSKVVDPDGETGCTLKVAIRAKGRIRGPNLAPFVKLSTLHFGRNIRLIKALLPLHLAAIIFNDAILTNGKDVWNQQGCLGTSADERDVRFQYNVGS